MGVGVGVEVVVGVGVGVLVGSDVGVNVGVGVSVALGVLVAAAISSPIGVFTGGVITSAGRLPLQAVNQNIPIITIVPLTMGRHRSNNFCIVCHPPHKDCCSIGF